MIATCVVDNVHLLLLQNMIKHDSGRSKHPLPARGRPRQRCCALGGQASPRVSMRRIFSSLLSEALKHSKDLKYLMPGPVVPLTMFYPARVLKGQRAVHARAVNDTKSPTVMGSKTKMIPSHRPIGADERKLDYLSKNHILAKMR